jgi:tetratricopeptide (TPR) repeat protein
VAVAAAEPLHRTSHPTQKNQCEDDYQFDPIALGEALTALRAIYHAGADCLPKYGKIFKLPEYLTLAASCHFYLADYAAAMDCLVEAI